MISTYEDETDFLVGVGRVVVMAAICDGANAPASANDTIWVRREYSRDGSARWVRPSRAAPEFLAGD